ncbi:MAG TPA: YeeE/YedE family protein [Pseudomonadota bacterium]|nr:YeeE/YedE family protein [Pseudomonadota bacterium]
MDLATYLPPLVGGLLIGSAATLFLWLEGRIAGISGIVGGLLQGSRGDIAWRMWFLAGLFLSPALILAVRGSLPAIQATVSTPTVLVAGLLVGIGTRIGSGCTSGHGVCGLGRRSPRSLAAVLTFIGTGMLTVWMMRHGAGGQP